MAKNADDSLKLLLSCERVSGAFEELPISKRGNADFLAQHFLTSAYLVTAIEFLRESWWIQSCEDKGTEPGTSLQWMLQSKLGDELSFIGELGDLLIVADISGLKQISQRALAIEALTIKSAQGLRATDKRQFVTHCLQEMSQLFVKAETEQQKLSAGELQKGPRLYRAFEKLDEVFDLDYLREKKLDQDYQSSERLYQGSGAMVQSGYSTILLALHHLNLQVDDRLIDLGSGYGRIGFIVGLLQPSVEFLGYEFVAHRVVLANETAESLGLEKKVKFFTQDLSLSSFRIPPAEVYYLYDPFTDSTYESVVQQILAVSRKQKVKVVTKGNARRWFEKIQIQEDWAPPIVLDQGNLCIFESPILS